MGQRSYVLEKRGRALVPIDRDGVDFLDSLPNEKRLVVTAHIPVNEKHYRLWWALANKVVKSGAYDGNAKQFKTWITWQTKRVEPVTDPETGQVFFVGSLSIDSFDDEEEFTEWFNLAIKIVCEKLLQRQDWAWLRKELIDAVERRNSYRGSI